MVAMDQEINAQAAAYRTGRNVRTIRRHIDDGSLPARKEHNGWRIRVADLEKRYSRAQQEPTRLVPVTSQSTDFHTHAHAARWLLEHGVNSESTIRHWPNWRATPLNQATVLMLAIRLCDTENSRITWRLKRCGRAACACAQLL
jgi:hypothetical protein